MVGSKELVMAISKLRVIQKKSLIGQNKRNRAVVAGLGLRGIGNSVVVENTPSMRGMIKKVIHLVEVEEVNG
jgi:large subunit ribosomal protein L30